MNAKTVLSMTHGLLIGLSLFSTSAVVLGMRPAAAGTPLPAAASPSGLTQCHGVGAKLARRRADAAFREARFHEAGQCYLVAGDESRANVAFIKEAAADNAGTKRQLAANANQVREQFRKWREALGNAFTSHRADRIQ